MMSIHLTVVIATLSSAKFRGDALQQQSLPASDALQAPGGPGHPSRQDAGVLGVTPCSLTASHRPSVLRGESGDGIWSRVV